MQLMVNAKSADGLRLSDFRELELHHVRVHKQERDVGLGLLCQFDRVWPLHAAQFVFGNSAQIPFRIGH